MKRNKWIGGMIASLVLAGLIGTVPVYAQGINGPGGGMRGHAQIPLTEDALAVAAEMLGITTDEVQTALDTGTSLKELAETAGIDFETLIQAVRDAMPAPDFIRALDDETLAALAEALGMTTDEIQAALDAGTTLEELATAAGVDFQTVLDSIHTGGPGRGFGGSQINDEMLATIAEALGMTTDELQAALDSGSTLEELATTAGVDLQTILPAPPNGGQPGQHGAMQLNDEALTAVAEALSMTTDEVQAALDAGTTLEELATTAGVDFQTVMEALHSAMPAPDGQNGVPPQDGSGGPGGPGGDFGPPLLVTKKI